MRRWLAVLVLLWVGGVASAQGEMTPWSAWLYNPNGTITHISSAGQVLQEYILPTVPGQEYPARVAVSRAGDIAAYVTRNPQLNTYRLVFFDLNTGALRSDYIANDLEGHSLALQAGPLVFDETASRLAFGTAPLNGVWQLLALDTATGLVQARLEAGDSAITALGASSGRGVVPVVQVVQNGEVAFILRQLDDPNDAILGSYRWTLETGVVRQTEPAAADIAFWPPSGDWVMPVADTSLPNANGVFAGGQRNTLQAILAGSNRALPFYNTPESTLSQPHFIQNGERVLVASAGTDRSLTWQVVERTGALVGNLPAALNDVFGLADGFIYLTATNPATLMVANTRDGIHPGLAVGQGAPDTALQLAWAGDAALTPTPTYLPWIDLKDPVSVAQVTQIAAAGLLPTPTAEIFTEEAGFYVAPTPVFLPTPSSFQSRLAVGQRAVVTPEGHGVGLRTEAQANAPALILLFSDMVVEVIDGPLITDGYIWWRVRTVNADPRTGWAIEGTQGAAWLLPTG